MPLVEARSGHPFRGLDEGLAAAWEDYKPRLRDHALGLLRPEDWLEGEIGSGAILNRTVEAIEIQGGHLNLTNNLVFWTARSWTSPGRHLGGGPDGAGGCRTGLGAGTAGGGEMAPRAPVAAGGRHGGPSAGLHRGRQRRAARLFATSQTARPAQPRSPPRRHSSSRFPFCEQRAAKRSYEASQETGATVPFLETSSGDRKCPQGMKPPRRAAAENSTLYVAIEISRKSWVIGIKSPVNERIGLHTIEAANVDALRGLIERHRAKAERVLKREMRVLNCYEAGYEGFWLARWLDGAIALETVVLDPASLLVNRKAKQRKTDRIDAKKMVRALLAHDRGDAAVLSRVRVPSVEEEDRKRLHRERQRLVKERTSLTNSIKGLLKLHGIFDLQPRSKDFEAKFADVKTACGEPLPPRARQEILRIAGTAGTRGRADCPGRGRA